MGKLEDKLKNFHASFKNEEGLEDEFKKLAKSFLYGGYVSVWDSKSERYRIFIRTVEFYCHCESGLPKDPIVYHRNGKYFRKKNEGNDNEFEFEVPYFPLMAFHAHTSGIDITFENKDLELRSSALIRAYEVYDVQSKKFLIYDTKSQRFMECQDGQKRVNPQSTYLYYFLNGFLGEYVKWEDKPWSDAKTVKADKRRNVFEYDDKEEIIEKDGKKVKDERKWSFTRTEEISEDMLK